MAKIVFREEMCFIEGPAGRIEALWQPIAAEATQIPPEIVVVICHPHSLHGGAMQNKVVTTVVRACHTLELASVRFNFRGVGRSEGVYDQGVGETEDTLAVIHWVQAQYPQAKIILAGFSFGAYVAQRTALKFNPLMLVSIAPPVYHFDVAKLAAPACPWVVIQGEEDEIVPPQKVYDWVEQQPSPPKLVRFPETSHFFHGKLLELQQVLVDEITRIVNI